MFVAAKDNLEIKFKQLPRAIERFVNIGSSSIFGLLPIFFSRLTEKFQWGVKMWISMEYQLGKYKYRHPEEEQV